MSKLTDFLSSAATTGSAIAGALNPYVGLVSGIGGLFGNLFGGKSSAEKQNEANIKFQREENAKNREFALDQMRRQYNYNTSAAITAWNRSLQMYQQQRDDNSLFNQMQQAKRAGVNPFAIFGNGAFNGASAPSAPLASPVSAPSANGVAPQYSFLEPSKYDRGLSKFNALADALSKLSSGLNSDASTNSLRQSLTEQLRKLSAEADEEEAKVRLAENEAALNDYFAFSERESALKESNKRVENLEKELVIKGKDIKMKDFEISLQEIKKSILNQEKELGYYKTLTALFNLQHLEETWRADIEAKKAQTRASNASSDQYLASAENLRADTQTKNESRPFVVGNLANAFQQGQIKTVDDAVKLANFIDMAPDLHEKLRKELQQMDQSRAIQQMEMLCKFLDQMPKGFKVTLPILGSFGFNIH